MTKKATGTNVLQDVWAGWLNFVREVTGAKSGGLKTPDLKTRPKRPNKVHLKRDLTVERRPQPKRTELVSMKKERALLKREPAEDVPKLAVDPPKPFKLAEEFLETPPERVSRLEKEQKKSL